jgi:hypothetical protein
MAQSGQEELGAPVVITTVIEDPSVESTSSLRRDGSRRMVAGMGASLIGRCFQNATLRPSSKLRVNRNHRRLPLKMTPVEEQKWQKWSLAELSLYPLVVPAPLSDN